MPKSVALEKEIEREVEQAPQGATCLYLLMSSITDSNMPPRPFLEPSPPANIKPAAAAVAVAVMEEDEIDAHMEKFLQANPSLRGRFVKISRGKYWLLRHELPPKQTFVRVLLDHVMVRVGGGWEELEKYCEKHP